MAAPMSCNGKRENCLKIEFNGKISNGICSQTVKEIIKFLLYHRQQIPLPYVQLRKVVKELSQADSTSHKPSSNSGKNSFVGSTEYKKLKQLLDAVEEVFTNVDALFDNHPEIMRILIILGATIVSPKETFEIEFDRRISSTPFSDIPSSKHCQRILNRSLITCNSLTDIKLPPVTSVHLLVQGQRSMDTLWLKPKLNFKVPKRGQYFTFHIACGGNTSSVIQSSSSQSVDSSKALQNTEVLEENQDSTGEDLLWFVAPKVIKGVKENILPVMKAEDIWV